MKSYVCSRLMISVEAPVYVMLIGMIAIQIATPLQINFIVSLGTWLILFATIMAFIGTLIKQKVNRRDFLHIIFLVMCVLFSMAYSFFVNYQYMVVAFSFLEIPLLMTSYSKCHVKNILRIIYACFILLSIYYIFLSFTPVSHIFYTEYGYKQMEFLTLGYNNPNETAMYLFVCIIILTALFNTLKKKSMKFLISIDIVLVVRLLILTLSRTAFLMLFIFMIATFSFKRCSIPNYVRILCLVAPFLFLIITFVHTSLRGNINFLLESIETGRYDIYITVFDDINLLSFLFGKYAFQFKNLHNSYWSIFATIGLLGITVFVSFLNTKIRDIQNALKDRIDSKIALMGLMSIIVYTSTEAAFLTVGGTFAASVVCVYLICIFEEQGHTDITKVK